MIPFEHALDIRIWQQENNAGPCVVLLRVGLRFQAVKVDAQYPLESIAVPWRPGLLEGLLTSSL